MQSDRSSKKLLLLIVLLALGMSYGCVEKKVNSASDSSSDNTNTSGNFQDFGDNNDDSNNGGGSDQEEEGGEYGYNHPDCSTGSPPGIKDGSQTRDYYKVGLMPEIIAHGTAEPNRHSDDYPDGVVWSSEDDLPTSVPPSIFTTDSRFNLRVKALEGVQGENDAKGNYCKFNPLPQTKLTIGVEVRAQGAASGDYFRFEDVNLNEFSKVHKFTVPPSTSGPLVVEIKDIEWDGSCKFYTSQGYDEDDHGVASVCPMAPVLDTQCVSLKFEFATDVTKDIPCPRVY